MKNRIDFENGFTLIELLVVISIIGVLTALLLSNFVGIRGRAKDAQLKGDLEQMKVGLRLYYNDFQQYPATGSGGAMNGCGVAGTTVCTTSFSAGSGPTTYMKELPEFIDYSQENSGDGFRAGIVLSNASDSDIASSVAECSVGTPTTNAFYVCAD